MATGGILGIVPARGGSKRLPRKNLKLLAGKPLVSWTLEAAAGSKCLDACVLSSDDPEILDLGRATPGVEVLARGAELAGDRARNVDVMRDVVARQARQFDYVVLLQPTCPLRSAADIDGAVSRCREANAEGCVSVTRFSKSSYWLFRSEAGRLYPIFERDAETDIREAGPPVFVPNGAVFVVRADALMAGRDYYSNSPVYFEMPRERSIDIDDSFDFALAERLLALAKGADT